LLFVVAVCFSNLFLSPFVKGELRGVQLSIAVCCFNFVFPIRNQQSPISNVLSNPQSAIDKVVIESTEFSNLLIA